MICHPVNFRSLSKKKQEKPIMPERFLEICPTAASHRRWSIHSDAGRQQEATGGTVLQPLLNRHLKKALERSKMRTS
ncbi:hypothetical protein OXX59_009631 [Metschnikowia pulcherrima]